jgi:hypothetical protein
MEGDAFLPRRVIDVKKFPRAMRDWERIYWAARSETWRTTFIGAMALFSKNHKWAWPDPEWPFMPKDEKYLHCRVVDVPMSELIPKPVPVETGTLFPSQA